MYMSVRYSTLWTYISTLWTCIFPINLTGFNQNLEPFVQMEQWKEMILSMTINEGESHGRQYRTLIIRQTPSWLLITISVLYQLDNWLECTTSLKLTQWSRWKGWASVFEPDLLWPCHPFRLHITPNRSMMKRIRGVLGQKVCQKDTFRQITDRRGPWIVYYYALMCVILWLIANKCGVE